MKRGSRKTLGVFEVKEKKLKQSFSNCYFNNKVRGLKRKTKSMVDNIHKLTTSFPEQDEFDEGYWHMHLPVAKTFIDSNKTPFSVRRLCIITLIEAGMKLSKMKKVHNKQNRVIIAIDLPNLSDSQIIIFFSEEYYNNFFNRDDDYQKWIPLKSAKRFQNLWNIKIPESYQIKGYTEEINEENLLFTNELWFIGEL
jgi:hypothetical protein